MAVGLKRFEVVRATSAWMLTWDRWPGVDQIVRKSCDHQPRLPYNVTSVMSAAPGDLQIADLPVYVASCEFSWDGDIRSAGSFARHAIL